MGGIDLEVRRVVNGQSDLLGSWRLQPGDEVELGKETRDTHVSAAAVDAQPGHVQVHVLTITGRDEDVVSDVEVTPGTIVKARGEEGDRLVELAGKDAQSKSDAAVAQDEEVADAVEAAPAADTDADEGEGEDTGTGPYEGRTNDQLRALARERGLSTAGSKDELIETLRA